MTDKKNIDGIILSAGLSSRIGSPKALLVYNEFNFVTNIILKLSPICKNIKIVTGYQSDEIKKSFIETLISKKDILFSSFNISREELSTLNSRVTFVKNVNFERGMFTSLQAGINAIGSSEYIIYHFVDQPTLPQIFYKKFAEQICNETDWLQPIFNGKKGHPIIFSKDVSSIIKNSGLNNNLRDINKLLSNKKYWECEYPEILHDIDTISEYNNIILKN